jgi:hypothetical protein
MNKSDTLGKLAEALSLLQGELEDATKNAKNPYFNSDYANLHEVLSKLRPLLSKYKLSVAQFPTFEKATMTLETTLMHCSGEWISNQLSLPLQKTDAQAVGSAITYARRYSLAAVFGLGQKDDDGNATVRTVNEEKVVAKTEAEPVEDPRYQKMSEVWTLFKLKSINKEEMKEFIKTVFPNGPHLSSAMTVSELEVLYDELKNKTREDILNIIKGENA